MAERLPFSLSNYHGVLPQCPTFLNKQKKCSFKKGYEKYECNFRNHSIKVYQNKGRAVAQAISRWLPTAAPRVLIRAACGLCGEQNGIRAGFLRVLRFSLPIIPPISPSS
jgi:hypothetical protein